jgi:hypothetical protein
MDLTPSFTVMGHLTVNLSAKLSIYRSFSAAKPTRGLEPHHYEEFSLCAPGRTVEPDPLRRSGPVCHACATVFDPARLLGVGGVVGDVTLGGRSRLATALGQLRSRSSI